jgi:hypothetical protein
MLISAGPGEPQACWCQLLSISLRLGELKQLILTSGLPCWPRTTEAKERAAADRYIVMYRRWKRKPVWKNKPGGKEFSQRSEQERLKERAAGDAKD